MKARPLIRTLGTIFVMVLLMTVLTRCGKTYHDSPPTNPLRTMSPPVSATYRADDRKETVVGLDDYERADALLSIFDNSQEEPHPAKWMFAGAITLTDSQGRVASIGLFTAGEDQPDVFDINGVYYRKSGLIDALDAWAATHRPTEEAPTDGP